MTILDKALALTGDGLPVFPCSPASKAPLVEGGFRAASTDPAKVATWWRENPDALIGVPTGPASGIDALDVDPRHGGDAWLKANAARLKGARVHTTRSGGIHVLFRHAEGLRNSSGTVASGIDVRSDGGYIVWWPAHGLRVSSGATAPWPADLLAEVSASRLRVPEAHQRDPAELAPPSAEAVVELLDALPNSLESSRDEWLSVLMATRGCIQGLDAVGQLTPEAQEAIEEALFAWCDRWPAAQEEDPREKWERDIMRRDAPLAGWQTLERLADRALPGRREEQAAAAFADDLPTTGGLLQELDAQTWADLDLPPTKQYLGAVLQTATRLNLIGSTGLGKTQITHAMACAIATGDGFGPWSGSGTPARVLIVDGEMSTRLLKARMAAALKRHGKPVAPGMLLVYGVDRSEHFTPWLGGFHPLNLPDGFAFIRRLIDSVAPEVVFFDNVMSLMSGDQKDEVVWSGALAMMSWLTRKRIAQIWLDHTGHNSNRQYGSVTKMWRADAVGVMNPVDKKEVAPGQVKFELTFAAPQGKARERDETNYQDFADRRFEMDADGWRCSEAKSAGQDAEKDPVNSLPPRTRGWYDALIKVCVDGKTTRREWMAEALSRGLVEPLDANATRGLKEKQRTKQGDAIKVLQEAGLLRVENIHDMILVVREEDDGLGVLSE